MSAQNPAVVLAVCIIVPAVAVLSVFVALMVAGYRQRRRDQAIYMERKATQERQHRDEMLGLRPSHTDNTGTFWVDE